MCARPLNVVATERGGHSSVADGEDGLNADIDLNAMPSEVFEGKADTENHVGTSIDDSVSDEQAIDTTESLRSELLQLMQSSEPGSRRISTPASTSLASCDGSESVAAACVSIADQDLDGEDEHMDAEDDDLEDNEEVFVAGVNDSGQSETEGILTPTEAVDASALMHPQQNGKRPQRDETRSEEGRVERDAENPEPKRKRPGLRESSERRHSYMADYVVNTVQSSARFLDN
ncbi:hypothetical protein PF002_g15321 [Phytophthora fragariae]|uniref:Uncharacterized protein n=2 Tax=Phytophthora fragariae TaxID=53985 RepID=A0A6A3YST7_9STRA|nr:hypothetical protein PF002_g15321 [Phytophthora fragariae]